MCTSQGRLGRAHGLHGELTRRHRLRGVVDRLGGRSHQVAQGLEVGQGQVDERDLMRERELLSILGEPRCREDRTAVVTAHSRAVRPRAVAQGGDGVFIQVVHDTMTVAYDGRPALRDANFASAKRRIGNENGGTYGNSPRVSA